MLDKIKKFCAVIFSPHGQKEKSIADECELFFKSLDAQKQERLETFIKDIFGTIIRLQNHEALHFILMELGRKRDPEYVATIKSFIEQARMENW